MYQINKNQSKENHTKVYPRRKFVKNLAIGALSLFGCNVFSRFVKASPTTYPPRIRVPNPFVSNEGKPLLVAVIGSDFKTMLKTGLEKIGGLSKLIDNNQDVLIKPNLNAVDVYPAISSADSIATLAEEVAIITAGKVKVGDVGFHPTSSVYEHLNLYRSRINLFLEHL